MTVDSLQDRFRGALLGLFAGDALGMPVELWSRERIADTFGVLREMREARLGAGTYTDDTQMALALAEALLEGPEDRIDRDRVAARFADHYEPARGYGGNTRRILETIRQGVPWRRVVEEGSLPGGSWANGAAMRVAPVALAFFPSRDRVAAAADEQAEVTGHTHPIGRFGARLQALAVLEALESGGTEEGFDVEGFLWRVGDGAPEEYRAAFAWIAGNLDADPAAAVASLGVSGRASASVPAALWSFLSQRDDPEEAVVRAVGLGGDTDTIGAMAGALAGAYRGSSALPRRWIDALEDGRDGKTHARSLADRLYARATTR